MFISHLLYAYCCCLVLRLCPTLCDPMNCSPPGSVHGIPRPEYWSGLPFPSPGDLSDPGIEPTSPSLAGGFFTAEPPEKPHYVHTEEGFL